MQSRPVHCKDPLHAGAEPLAGQQALPAVPQAQIPALLHVTLLAHMEPLQQA